jgi:hypothetical protein
VCPLLGPPGSLGQGRPGLGDASKADLAAATGGGRRASLGTVGSGEQLGLFECAVWLHVLIMPRGCDHYPLPENTTNPILIMDSIELAWGVVNLTASNAGAPSERQLHLDAFLMTTGHHEASWRPT